MIQSLGTGQAAAFLKSKDKPHAKSALAHLTEWLCGPDSPVSDLRSEQKQPDLMDLLVNNDASVWRRVDDEAIEFAIWMKRFAEAKIRSPKRRTQSGGSDGGSD
jgi:CRISPR type III-B/RAMP module-associated protein Cmr5